MKQESRMNHQTLKERRALASSSAATARIRKNWWTRLWERVLPHEPMVPESFSPMSKNPEEFEEDDSSSATMTKPPSDRYLGPSSSIGGIGSLSGIRSRMPSEEGCGAMHRMVTLHSLMNQHPQQTGQSIDVPQTGGCESSPSSNDCPSSTSTD